MHKVPLRKCVITKEILPKSELFRVVIVNDEVIYDPTGKLNGRGAYLKKDLEVIKLAEKKLEYIIKFKIKEDLFEELKKELNK